MSSQPSRALSPNKALQATYESLRHLWRLHHLREWSHEEIDEVFTGAA